MMRVSLLAILTVLVVVGSTCIVAAPSRHMLQNGALPDKIIQGEADYTGKITTVTEAYLNEDSEGGLGAGSTLSPQSAGRQATESALVTGDEFTMTDYGDGASMDYGDGASMDYGDGASMDYGDGVSYATGDSNGADDELLLDNGAFTVEEASAAEVLGDATESKNAATDAAAEPELEAPADNDHTIYNLFQDEQPEPTTTGTTSQSEAELVSMLEPSAVDLLNQNSPVESALGMYGGTTPIASYGGLFDFLKSAQVGESALQPVVTPLEVSASPSAAPSASQPIQVTMANGKPSGASTTEKSAGFMERVSWSLMVLLVCLVGMNV